MAKLNCKGSLDGNHYWIKDNDQFKRRKVEEKINKNQVKVKVLEHYITKCDNCGMVKEHKEEETESYIKWVGEPTGTVDNRGLLGKLFCCSMMTIDPYTGAQIVENASSYED